MSFDGIFTHAMVDELKSLLKNGRLSKIHQPYQSEIILVMRANGKNHRVLLSAHPSYARIQVTQIPYENPNTPPNFCMLLRKQLEGAILEDIQQIGNDRIIHFTFKSRDEIGDIHNVVLIVELMGRHSNIFLIDQESKRIIDCIKHVPASLNSYRSVMPGATYLNPPHQDKLNPFTVTKQEISETLDSASELSIQRQLQTTYQGIGGDTAAEIIFRSESNLALLPEVFVSLISEVKDGNATPTLTTNTQKDFFTPTPFLSLEGEQKTFPLLSELLDAYYGGKAEKDRVHQQGSELIRLVNNELQKNVKKLEKLHKTMAETELADDYRIKGEILTAYLHEFKRGAPEIKLPNFYEEDAPITIKLDIRKNPSQNAQKYFAKYQKLKNAIAYVTEQIDLTMGEIDYLESVSTQLSLATPKDVAEIKEELTQVGYLKKKKTKKKQMKAQKSKPEKYHATDGTVILVGKNNLQNDELTLKLARKSDIWLHTKNIPGSHVIIQHADPSEETILEAANIAAYYSKSQLSALVPVDYVPVKAIRKPNGAKPGFVIYEGQKTVYVTPDKELVESLRVN
ncbi:NFACT RNA binding domain-containing protein [Carnobacterium divergens]|uniref:Rqc2 homolog RqcH n=1 Tax=Carnobacterium divergens TaxID=2748 RepID=A0A2R8A0A1_CARDV|nr:NFACT RNA binding domain-containing protein [Carnobacterium divergens]MCO6017799.1 NFACT family protein [Carnobacterium divergens]TFI60784.1 fibronectin/fibrinogen-binding protein [Carnobacterium divergens]TFI71374.1 fibronectin/fibrinogen-binding protein [Carnobacterium divergens]TFI76016.1 fibronectin/fibrinogen-binding protein [Carnobacterium divergens]TFI81888.1 fibronectin/fibrinogen-binding protein [Carnobacterium divergens]